MTCSNYPSLSNAMLAEWNQVQTNVLGMLKTMVESLGVASSIYWCKCPFVFICQSWVMLSDNETGSNSDLWYISAFDFPDSAGANCCSDMMHVTWSHGCDNSATLIRIYVTHSDVCHAKNIENVFFRPCIQPHIKILRIIENMNHMQKTWENNYRDTATFW